MAIIPPLLSRSGLLEVMLANNSNSVIVIDENEIEYTQVEKGGKNTVY